MRLARGGQAHGLDVLRLDWTHGHERGDTLAELLTLQRKAFKVMSAGKSAFSQKLKRAGIVYAGMRRALDYVHGESGHHPHQHGILLVEGNIEDVTSILIERWQTGTRKAGLYAGGAGVTVALSTAEGAGYLYKTGERPDEDGQRGRTPHQLLRAYSRGDERAGAIWREYALAVDGQRLTATTPGLKALAQLAPDGADELLAAQSMPGLLVVEFNRWEGVTPDVWASITTDAPGLAAD